VLKIELEGSGAGDATVGIRVQADGCTIRGLVINQFGGNGLGNGIEITNNVSDNLIIGNFIGTDVSGTTDLGNTSSGVSIFDGSDNNTVGGVNPADRNLISGNNIFGVGIDNSFGNVVQGNFIGTDLTGTQDLGNGFQGMILGASSQSATVGGTSGGAGNLISGNDLGGIDLNGSDHIVQGNLIGTDRSGSLPLPNVGPGIKVAVLNNTLTLIGGVAAGSGNIIAFNQTEGIFLRDIGLDYSGILILGNSIFSNGALGIDLSAGGIPDGVTLNDAGDGDVGPNGLLNFPVLTSAILNGGIVTIQGTLNSTANAQFRIEFYSNDACDDSDHGEGQTFLGFLEPITTDGGGNASFNSSFPALGGTFITATASDANENTSEFSKCMQLLSEICDNGTDDEGDGQTDCDDLDCASDPNCVPTEDCDNFVDDDGDGALDCSDTDCAADFACALPGELSGSGGCQLQQARTLSVNHGIAFWILLAVPILASGVRKLN
jgi:hypothetical protein